MKTRKLYQVTRVTSSFLYQRFSISSWRLPSPRDHPIGSVSGPIVSGILLPFIAQCTRPEHMFSLAEPAINIHARNVAANKHNCWGPLVFRHKSLNLIPNSVCFPPLAIAILYPDICWRYGLLILYVLSFQCHSSLH